MLAAQQHDVIHIQTPSLPFFAARVVPEARRVQCDSARIVPYARYRKNLGMSPGRRTTCKLSHTANKGRSYGPTTRQLLESLAHFAELASVAELGKQPTDYNSPLPWRYLMARNPKGIRAQ